MEFKQQVNQVCQLYLEAQQLQAQGVHIVSTDEMTGIQAIERADPTQAMTLGEIERVEFEYIRHGTLSLIASWDVAAGRVLAPSLGTTRNAADFTAHIANTLLSDPQAKWIFLVDQLNTHKSEDLVRLVQQQCELDVELGIKGKQGILQSMATRANFLADPSHRIQFVYLPKHTFWLNQIECWFSILVRRLLRRGNFTSTADLRQQILDFIADFNRTFAKPFQWKFEGYTSQKKWILIPALMH